MKDQIYSLLIRPAFILAEIIAGDPHNQNASGKLLFSLIKDFNLIIVNVTKKCSGTMTIHTYKFEKKRRKNRN